MSVSEEKLKGPNELKQKYLSKLSGILGVDDIFKPVAATEYDNAF